MNSNSDDEFLKSKEFTEIVQRGRKRNLLRLKIMIPVGVLVAFAYFEMDDMLQYQSTILLVIGFSAVLFAWIYPELKFPDRDR